MYKRAVTEESNFKKLGTLLKKFIFIFLQINLDIKNIMLTFVVQ